MISVQNNTIYVGNVPENVTKLAIVCMLHEVHLDQLTELRRSSPIEPEQEAAIASDAGLSVPEYVAATRWLLDFYKNLRAADNERWHKRQVQHPAS